MDEGQAVKGRKSKVLILPSQRGRLTWPNEIQTPYRVNIMVHQASKLCLCVRRVSYACWKSMPEKASTSGQLCSRTSWRKSKKETQRRRPSRVAISLGSLGTSLLWQRQNGMELGRRDAQNQSWRNCALPHL